MSASNLPMAAARPRQDHEPAAVRAEFLDECLAAVEGHSGGGKFEDHLATAGPVTRALSGPEPAGHEGGHLTSGQLARSEARPRRSARGDPIGTERTPILAVQVPGEEVPAPAPGDEVMRLHPARRGLRAVVVHP